MARILVVHRDEAIRRLLGEVLGRAGHVVISCNHTSLVEDQVKGVAVAAAVTHLGVGYDVDNSVASSVLNILEGLELSIPMVVVTGGGVTQDVRANLEARGVKDFVLSPLYLNELLPEAVRTALEPVANE